MEYDYIIVGAGAAGCVLAYRLTEDASTKVLLRGGKVVAFDLARRGGRSPCWPAATTHPCATAS